MANYRRGRINDEMQKELAMILREVKDPRVKDAFISITAVEATGDLKFAKVYYSAMLGDKKEVAKGLKSCAGYIRRELAHRLNKCGYNDILTFELNNKSKPNRHENDKYDRMPIEEYIAECYIRACRFANDIKNDK